MAEDNSIFIGKKSAMNYVLAVITQFNKGTGNEVVIKARGKSISRAVDVAEIIRKKFITDVVITDIKIDTDEITIEDNSKMNISSIEIYLEKPEQTPV